MTFTPTEPERRVLDTIAARGRLATIWAGIPSQYAMLRRIQSHYARATAADRWAGQTWYPTIRAMLADAGDQLGVDLPTMAGIFAATSPRCRVETNLRITIRVARGDRHVPGLGRNIATARSILTNGPDRLLTFDPAGTIDRARKTKTFAANILGDTERVTVDAWAQRGAGLLLPPHRQVSGGAYVAVQDAYRRAAELAGVTPSTMQATVWVVVRGNPGTDALTRTYHETMAEAA